MPESLPAYRDGDQIYRPDQCENVRRGMSAGQVRLEALARGRYPGRRFPRNVLPGLRSLGFWDADRDQNWGTGWHYNEGLELGLLEAGQLTFSLSDRKHCLRPGDATVTRPWLRHCLGNPCVGAARAYWLVLDAGVRGPGDVWRWPFWVALSKSDRQELSHLVQVMESHVWQANFDLRRCFQRMGQVVLADREGSHTSLLAVLVSAALVLLLDALRQPKAALGDPGHSARRRVDEFWKELRANSQRLGEPWNVPALARCCGLGPTQFIAYTRELTNLAPLHYLRLCRIETAARWLLERPERTVTQIALAAGFNSGQYFAKVFQGHFGCTPNTYRAASRTDRPAEG